MPDTDTNGRGLRNVFAISLSFFLIFFGFGTAQQYLVIIFDRQGQGRVALLSLLLIYAAFMLTSGIASRIIPWLGGLKRSLLIGAFAYVLFGISLVLNDTLLTLSMSALVGIGAGLLWISSAQIISDSSGTRTVGRNLGIQTVGLYCGNILGLYATNYMLRVMTVSHMFFVLAVVTAFGFVSLLIVVPLREEIVSRPFRFGYVFDKRMLAIFPLLFGSYYLLAQVFTAMNVIIVGLLGIASLPLLISVVKVSNIAGSLGSGMMSGRASKTGLLLFLVATALFGIVFFTMAHTLIPLLIAAVLLGLSMASIYPVTLALLKETLPADDYLYALGTFNVYNNMGVIAAIVANGLLSASTSFIPGAIALTISIPGILLFRNSMLKEKRAK